MGLSNSTKKTTANSTSNSTSSATTTPNVPDWAAGPVQNYFGQVGGLISQNWNNPDFLATPTNSLQQTAANNAANLPTGQGELSQSNAFATQAGNASAPSYTAATASSPQIGYTPSVQAASLLDGLDNYFNPYEQRVVDTTLAGFDVNADRQRGDALAAGARNRGLAGSRFGVGQAVMEGELARERGALDAGIRSAGFDRATSLSGQDADRRQSASLSNAQLGMQRALAQAGFDANTGLFNAGAANDASRFNATSQNGAYDRQLAAAGLLSNNAATGSGIANNNAATQANIGQGLWNVDQYNNGAQLLGLGGIQGLLDGYQPFVGQNVYGTESGTTNGTQTQTSNGGLLGTLGSALKIGASAASLFSDRRLKTNIERVGEEPDGLGIYEYDYLWEGPRRRGVMADEVAALRPWAMGPEVAGYATVNYGAL